MLAAETIFDALLEGDYSSKTLIEYEHRVKRSWITPSCAVIEISMRLSSRALAGNGERRFTVLTGGRAWGFLDRDHQEPGHEAMRNCQPMGIKAAMRRNVTGLRFDGQLTFKKLQTSIMRPWPMMKTNRSIFTCSTHICATRCAEEYGNPCQRFCRRRL